MRVKHLRKQLDEISKTLEQQAPEDFPSDLAISQITGLAKGLSVLGQVRLGAPEPLTAKDEWLLSAFYNTHLHDEFEDTFRRICAQDHDDFHRLYDRANLFFYRAHDPGQDIARLIARFRDIMDGIVGETTCDALLERLRAFNVIVEEETRPGRDPES